MRVLEGLLAGFQKAPGFFQGCIGFCCELERALQDLSAVA